MSISLTLLDQSLRLQVPDAALSWLEFDFAQFLGPTSPFAPSLEWKLAAPPPLPSGLNEAFRGVNCVVFPDGPRRYVVYRQGGLLLWDPVKQSSIWQCSGFEPGYTRLICLIHSLFGSALEGQGRQPVHGLGLSHQGAATLVLLPPGGGKSTLAQQLLEQQLPVQLLSEDTPLLDDWGRLGPYPFRIGLRQETSLPSQRRQQKWLVPFPSDWSSQFLPCRRVCVGVWTSRSEPGWEPISSLGAGLPILRDLLVAYGVSQLLELQWPIGWAQRWNFAARLARRLKRATRLAYSAQWGRLWLCPDARVNAAFLARLVSSPPYSGEGKLPR